MQTSKHQKPFFNAKQKKQKHNLSNSLFNLWHNYISLSKLKREGRENDKLFQLGCWLGATRHKQMQGLAKQPEPQSAEDGTSLLTALPAPTEQRTEESGEKALLYTQFWCPRRTFTMLPSDAGETNKQNQSAFFDMVVRVLITHYDQGMIVIMHHQPCSFRHSAAYSAIGHHPLVVLADRMVVGSSFILFWVKCLRCLF